MKKESIKIIVKKFHTENYGEENYLKSWPVVYILKNDRKVYIGETTNFIRRMSEHKRKKGDEKLKDVYIIYSDEFNQSVTFSYESNLIQYMVGEGRYKILNKNKGISEANYYIKDEYDKVIPYLWGMLKEYGLVSSTMGDIRNTELYKYSPYKELVDEQYDTIEGILEDIHSDKKTIIVKGLPGSGKTILATYLFKYMRDSEEYAGKKIGLVIPQTSLRKTIKKLFSKISGLMAKDVIGPHGAAKEKYDFLLVDEVHRLHQKKNIREMKAHSECNEALGLEADATQLDWILEQAGVSILFYDKNQVIGPSGISNEMLTRKILEKYPNRFLSYYNLHSQLRVKGGVNYIEYVKDILKNKEPKRLVFTDYEFKLIESFEKFNEKYYRKVEESDLTRMISGYAWPWISNNNKELKDIEIDGISRMWNCQTENWVYCDTAVDEVGCIHSIQGYDLNYAFVIMGNDIGYDPITKKIICRRENYYDRFGKNNAKDEDLLEYITNIYYVLLTRGMIGTYLYVCDEELREYLKRYIDVIKE